MKMYSASFEIIVWRFYLMMAVVFIPFLIGVPLLAIAAVPVFLSALMGVSFTYEKKAETAAKSETLYPDTNPEFLYPRAA